MKSKLILIIPCYNEELVLPKTAPIFLRKLKQLIQQKKISPQSKILFVNDGSSDQTWHIIKQLSLDDAHFMGISQLRNYGHQNALLAGLMEARSMCDFTISIDCDGQDDINAIDDMINAYCDGAEIVYGVRNDRSTDSAFKRSTAQIFYKFLQLMGVNTIYNHADYRLASSRVLNELANFQEVNLFLRGLFPLLGFKSARVYYRRKKRIDGTSHYPIKKMLGLALDGITSFSIKPIRIISWLGFIIMLISFLFIIWSIVTYFMGRSFNGWSSIICVLSFFGGMQVFCIGVIGEYIGKIYLEAKARPRYIISEKTY